MNLKKQNGYVGIDISIAILVLLLVIPTITGMMYNASKTNKESMQITEAVNIAVNVLEIAKSIGVESLSNENIQTKITSELLAKLEDSSLIVEKPSGTYKINFDVTDYANEHLGAEQNKVKTVKAEVQYFASGTTKSINISTVIT